MTHKLLRHIQAILDSNGLEWTSQRNGVALRFDSSIVSIDPTFVGRQRIIVLQSNVLSDLRKSDKQEVLTELNRLNCGSSIFRGGCGVVMLLVTRPW